VIPRFTPIFIQILVYQDKKEMLFIGGGIQFLDFPYELGSPVIIVLTSANYVCFVLLFTR